MKKTDNKKVQDLLTLKECPIKIEDIMGDFDENADIEEYKEVLLTKAYSKFFDKLLSRLK
jgi:hypothetical protein